MTWVNGSGGAGGGDWLKTARSATYIYKTENTSGDTMYTVPTGKVAYIIYIGGEYKSGYNTNVVKCGFYIENPSATTVFKYSSERTGDPSGTYAGEPHFPLQQPTFPLKLTEGYKIVANLSYSTISIVLIQEDA